MSHTVLQVPVPELEPFVLPRTAHYDTDYVSPDPAFVHAHVTALSPFVTPDRLDAQALDLVGEIASTTASFTFELSQIATFPNGIIHLVPEPDEPFRRLTARLWQAFPDCPPYAGEFGDVRPHLTLDARSERVSEPSTRALLGDLVPASCRAERLDLAWYEAGRCRVLRSWVLGEPHGGRDASRTLNGLRG
jgi:2'-5' RNA ligase